MPRILSHFPSQIERRYELEPMANAQKVAWRIAEVYKNTLFSGFLSNSEHLNRIQDLSKSINVARFGRVNVLRR
jgi:hypothetical protein